MNPEGYGTGDCVTVRSLLEHLFKTVRGNIFTHTTRCTKDPGASYRRAAAGFIAGHEGGREVGHDASRPVAVRHHKRGRRAVYEAC